MAARQGPDSTSQNAGLLLYLSLYFLLLAFFVLLNAISLRDHQKVEAVLGSVGRTFTIDPRLNIDPEVTATREAGLAALQGLVKLSEVFDREALFARIDHVVPARTLAVDLPADVLFVRDGAAVRPERRALMDRIAETLRNRPTGWRIDVEAVVATTPPPGKSAPIVREAALTRAAQLARTLVAAGAPADSVSVGLERGEAGRVRMRFFAHVLEPVRGKIGEGGGDADQ
ncbi:MAG TPA: hypothetical protein VEB64_06055 [Azospirillaceae bacterium]|nr:hypothetical protein [Azospirillaceae bacterium]